MNITNNTSNHSYPYSITSDAITGTLSSSNWNYNYRQQGSIRTTGLNPKAIKKSGDFRKLMDQTGDLRKLMDQINDLPESDVNPKECPRCETETTYWDENDYICRTCRYG